MNNKENAVVMLTGGELSAEQRARISQSFRAAKALLARKRPRLESGIASDHLLSNQKGCRFGDEIKRLPLSEICANISSPVSLKGCKLSRQNSDDAKNGAENEILITPVRQAECCSRPCLGDESCYENELKDEGFGVQKVCLSLEDGSISNTRWHQDTSNEFESSSNSQSIKPIAFPDMDESILTSNFLSDDFDESILEQIDALCELKSSGNSAREDSATNRLENETIIKSCEEGVTIKNADVTNDILKCKKILDSAGDKACGFKGLGKSENKIAKDMPEEYANYIQSLNDKQQEAACSDISVPLLIVAGPGSGKVCFSPIF